MKKTQFVVAGALVLAHHDLRTGDCALEVIGKSGQTMAGFDGEKFAVGCSARLARKVRDALVNARATYALRVAASILADRAEAAEAKAKARAKAHAKPAAKATRKAAPQPARRPAAPQRQGFSLSDRLHGPAIKLA